MGYFKSLFVGWRYTTRVYWGLLKSMLICVWVLEFPKPIDLDYYLDFNHNPFWHSPQTSLSREFWMNRFLHQYQFPFKSYGKSHMITANVCIKLNTCTSPQNKNFISSSLVEWEGLSSPASWKKSIVGTGGRVSLIRYVAWIAVNRLIERLKIACLYCTRWGDCNEFALPSLVYFPWF